ncbi:MAG TPA: Gfo/Idh/MocA family oxidoreductase [Limnochordia bacterium]|nr:Gfo/Idh/MocA family oxidoreductase [Limnochordia bacterium]
MIGFGVAGCGAISRAHLESIKLIPDAKLVAVWNRTPERAQATAETYGCRFVRDLDELVNDPEIQVINVCTASGAHLEPALAAARAGKHVLVEKPLETTPERCDQIIAACAEHGVKLGVIFPSRLGESVARIRRALAEGRFGKLVLGTATVPWFRSQEYYDSGAWRGTWRWDGGGALMNQAIHQVDVLQWLLGPVTEVSAYTGCLAHERLEVEDTATAILRFANGAQGMILAATSLAPGFPVRIEVFGSGGSAILAGGKLVEWHTTDGEHVSEAPAPAQTRGAASNPMDISFTGHQRLIEDMMAAIQNDRPPLIDGREGRKSVALIDAVYRAAREGRPVRLDP